MDHQEARTKADEILARMQTDDAFRQQVASDPRGALTTAGVPSGEVDEEALKLGSAGGGEVQGYTYTAALLTCCCIRTSCCIVYGSPRPVQ